jgi:hypothetical protein
LQIICDFCLTSDALVLNLDIHESVISINDLLALSGESSPSTVIYGASELQEAPEADFWRRRPEG